MADSNKNNNNNNNNKNNKIKITVCGDGGCGKSSITLRLVRSQWTHEYDPTIEDSYSVTRTIDGTTYSLRLTDTAGQEEYRGLWSQSNLACDAFLLVYDITQASSLEALESFVKMIEVERENRVEQGKGPLPFCVVAGNKCDLQGMRQVSSAAGMEWARANGYGFMETSAREMVNIEETFAIIVRRVVESRRQFAAGVKPTLPSSTSRTAPLAPLPLQHSEKGSPSTLGPDGSRDYNHSYTPAPNQGKRKKSFWRMLGCW